MEIWLKITLTQNLLQHVSWPIITGNLHWLYKTLEEHLPNVEMHPLFPSKQPQFIGAWILQGVGCWPMLTPKLPTFVSNCPLGSGPFIVLCTLGSGPFLRHTQPNRVAVFDTNQCAWHLPYPVQRHLNILSCPFNLWMTHIHNPCLKV